jgi:O-antigen biosynthesis protein
MHTVNEISRATGQDSPISKAAPFEKLTPKEQPLNVVFFGHSAELNGAERSLLSLVEDLVRYRRAICTVILPQHGPLERLLCDVGASVSVMPFNWWCSPEGATSEALASTLSVDVPAFFCDIVPFVRNIAPDVIVTQTMVIPWGAVAAAALGKPHIWSVCEYGELDHGLHFVEPFDKIIADIEAGSEFVFVNSYDVKKILFPNLPSERCDVLYRHVEIGSAGEAASTGDSPDHERPVVGLFGIVARSKGQADAIEAVARLKARGISVELVLAGAGEQGYVEELKQCSQDLGVGELVRFTGPLENPYPEMRACDIVLVCSRREAFGRTAVEAMLMAKPLIYTASGGVSEFVKDGTTGLSYPPGEFGILADRIETLIRDGAFATRLGQAAEIFARATFTRENYGSKFHKKALALRGAASKHSNFPKALLSAIRRAAEIQGREVASLQQLAADLRTKVAGLEADVAAAQSQIEILGANELPLIQRHQEDRAVEQKLADDRLREIERLIASRERAEEANEALRQQLAAAQMVVGDLQKRSTSSRWLLRTMAGKVIHAPRDLSRRLRRSWRKRRSGSELQFATKGGEFNFQQLRNAQYRKYISSRMWLTFEPVLPKSFSARMRKRMAKNAPLRSFDTPLIVPTSLAPSWSMFEALTAEPRVSYGETPLLDVIIPVYRGYDETLSCIYSVLTSRNTTPFELVVIDDASPDPVLSDVLGRLARMKLITLLRNEQNLGFVGTVNRGMAMHEARDVILLNSDTIVANDWLDRIRAHALTPDVASVTPFTNNGTICSYPEFCKDNLHELEVSYARLDLMAAAINRNHSIEVPTGVGFCMYITREALRKTGLFDVETFGRGYGEENDFCVRASQVGMRNLHALDVFVYHAGETSFGENASNAKRSGLNALVAKHPDYLNQVHNFIELDLAKMARTRLDIARMLKGAPEQIVLCFTHTLGGGIERYLRDRAQSAVDTGKHFLLAVPHRSDPSVIHLTTLDGRLDLPNLPEFSLVNDVEPFVAFLKSLPIVGIEVHSTVGWSSNLLQFVPRIASAAQIPFDFMAHDYVSACPQINLINESGVYCGEGGEEQCRRCVATLPRIPYNIHPDMQRVGMEDIAVWRDNYYRFLQQAGRVLAPSNDTAKRLQTYFSRVEVIAHPPEDVQSRARPVAKSYLGGILEVVVIGAIGPHKGSKVLLNCAEDALRRRLPIRFTIVGTTDISDLASRPNVRVTGAYTEGEVYDRLAEVGAHVALMPSVWPETYCYTLSIAMAGRLPICAFDIGAPAQRLRSGAIATLLPTSMMTDAAGINDTLLKNFTVDAANLRNRSSQPAMAS